MPCSSSARVRMLSMLSSAYHEALFFGPSIRLACCSQQACWLLLQGLNAASGVVLAHIPVVVLLAQHPRPVGEATD